jgi:hypothetical protein
MAAKNKTKTLFASGFEKRKRGSGRDDREREVRVCQIASSEDTSRIIIDTPSSVYIVLDGG